MSTVTKTTMVTKEVSRNDSYQVGDIVSAELYGDENKWHSFLAVKEEENGMIFIFRDCLKELKPVFSTENLSGRSADAFLYENSDIRKYLQDNLVKMFPQDIAEILVPFENGDLFRLATKREIFGEGKDCSGQWEPMKDCRNRVALDKDGDSVGWWLQDDDDMPFFDCVDIGGQDTYIGAAHDIGVRPVFKVKNH